MASSQSRIPVRMNQIVFVTVASYSHVAIIHSLYHNAKPETSYNFPTLMKRESGEILTMSGKQTINRKAFMMFSQHEKTAQKESCTLVHGISSCAVYR